MTSGCYRKTVKPDFDYIEFSIWNEMGGSTVRLDSNRLLTRCKYKIIQNIESCDCYRDTADKGIIDSVNRFIKRIRTQKIDSVYNSNCQDCQNYLLKIKGDDFEVKTYVQKILNDKSIDSLVYYLRNIPTNKYNRLDSCYTFETTKFLLPPKPN